MKVSDVKNGMVVCYKKLDRSWVRVASKPDNGGNVFIEGHQYDTWAHVSEIRPLTKRERGEGGAK